MIKQIISGGQTGVDKGALIAAVLLNIPTGGYAPKGYKTERGSDYNLRDIYCLKEARDSGYTNRTKYNILISSATVILGDITSKGSKFTIEKCKHYGKPYIVNPKVSALSKWILDNKYKIINVAGNRESVNPGAQERTKKFMIKVLKKIQDGCN